MSALLGWLWWWLIPARKGLAVANFARCFPERDPRTIRSHVGVLAWSYVLLLLRHRARVEGAEHVQAGGICLGGHGGSWDLALVSLSAQVPVTIFVKRPSNPVAAWLIDRLRRGTDLELLPPTDSMAAAYRALERGRLVIFVQDQRHNCGLPVPFFGRSAWTSPAFAAMVWRTRAPTFGVWQWHEGGRYIVRVEPLPLDVPEDRDGAIATLTARSQRFYEEHIHAHPEQWLWLHDRWKVPVSPDDAGRPRPGGGRS